MQIEKLTFSDIGRTAHLQQEGWSSLKEHLEFYTSHDYCFPIKLTIDDQIAATGTAIFFGKTAWLAHIIVDEKHRRKGIGQKIVEHLLNDLLAKGTETILLIATALGEPVYAKVGFKKVADYRFFKRENAFPQQKLSGNIRPYTNAYFSDVIQLDAFVAAEHRERILNSFLANASVYLEKNRVSGFYIPDLNEGPIFANTHEAGIELMRLKYTTIEKATIPADNNFGIKFLQQNGFVEARENAARMIFGKEIAWKPEMVYSRIGGNLG